jgi:hypothetical protein
MNVIVSIEALEVEILEKIQPDDNDFNALKLDEIQHR